MLTIKKYANGRLFDTVNKKYVTKDKLSKWIKEKKKIKIIVAKTGKDVTKSVISSLPDSKKAGANGKNKFSLNKTSIKKQVEGHKKWITKQINKRMDAALEMMNFPNKRQIVKLNADVKKLAQKVDDLQERHVQTREKMKRDHKRELEILAQQYDERLRTENLAPATSNG